jgi:hypothetical protein
VVREAVNPAGKRVAGSMPHGRYNNVPKLPLYVREDHFMRYIQAATLVLVIAGNAVADDKPDGKAAAFFETSVRPLLVAQCYTCHSSESDKAKGGLQLDTREGLLKGGKHGAAIVPGKAGESLLVRAISGDTKKQMPPKKPLTEEQIGILTRWVEMGAPWPAKLATPLEGEGASGVAAKYEQIRREHWAFQPLKAVPSGTTIDQLIGVKLAEHQLSPSKPADRRTLIRRATFDLTGLPPTAEEVEAFVNDSSSTAFAKVVDRLLASPTFGERWGRHWLDVARYAESTGMGRNQPYYYAWRYRDYVIDAFNADKPFDRFIKEQIAGDLLPASGKLQRDQLNIATGFLALGPKDLNERNPTQFSLNNVDEQIDTTTRAFLGLTVACARCHDHKFDPIPTAEYYSMAGIFRSTELLAGISPKRGARDYYDAEKLVKLSHTSERESEVVALQRKANDEPDAKSRREKRREFLKQRGISEGEVEIRPVALGVAEGRLPADSNIFIRGEVTERGPVVPRGTVSLPGMSSIGPIPSDQSGRLQLADWIANESNPLTARVMVNRIWQHLFGSGLVSTVDNYGTTGEPPTHPELLDHLARQFMKDGWSVKRAIRQMMLTKTYQQAGTFDEAKFATDPDNRMLWRASPRRLEGEAIRDAMLAVAGTLETDRPVGSQILRLPPGVGAGGVGRFAERFGAENNTRSVYLTALRGAPSAALDAFDLADNTQVTGNRDVTTVAPQALFMMNDPFVIAQAKSFASRLAKEQTSDLARVDHAYAMALGRVPTDDERRRVVLYTQQFVDEAGSDKKKRKTAELGAWASVCQALFASAEFRYVN